MEVRKWLEGAGFAPAAIGGLVSPWADHAEAAVVDARAFQRALFDAGFAGLGWPERYGGRGLTPRHEYIFDQEAGRYELPSGVFSIGLGMCGPTLLAHGTEEQKVRYIPPMLQGEEIWSQVFSEPGAGSDLAALRTRAVPRRRHVDPHRAEGLDLGRPDLAVRPGAGPQRRQAAPPRRAHHVHRRSRRPRRVAAAAQADDRSRQVRRGLPRRRAGGGRPPGRRRERRLALRHHHAHERAVLRRRAQVRPAGRLGPAHLRQGAGVGPRREPGRSPATGPGVGRGERSSATSTTGWAGRSWPAATPAPRGRSSSWPWGPSSGSPPRPGPTWSERPPWPGIRTSPAADGWSERLCGAPCFTIAGGTTEVLKNLVAERVLGLPRDSVDDRNVPFDEWIRRFDST